MKEYNKQMKDIRARRAHGYHYTNQSGLNVVGHKMSASRKRVKNLMNAEKKRRIAEQRAT